MPNPPSRPSTRGSTHHRAAYHRPGLHRLVSGFVALVALLALLLVPALPADAGVATPPPPVTLPGTELRTLTAQANGVEYKLYVGLPRDYEGSERRYGVVYLLDADYSFAIARNVVEHLADRDDLEPLILVGIAYGGPPAYRMNRTRDYTPTRSLEGGYGPEYQKVSGGGPKFARFLEEELIPWVDRTYRTVPGRRGFVGHSYGGLFGSWVLWTKPRLFQRYVLVSPSIWYDDKLLLRLPPPEDGAGPAAGTRVYLSVGAREGNSRIDMVGDLGRFAERLEKTAPGVALRHEVPDDETHNSVFPTALSRGLRWTFEGR